MEVLETAAQRAACESLRLKVVKEDAKRDPKVLIAEMRGFDPTQQEYFGFEMYPASDDPYWPYEEPRGADPEETDGWLWQAEIVDWWHDPVMRKFIMLKARQLGITWLACAYGIWCMLMRPGSAVVAYSYDQEQSRKLIQRTWLMFMSLPAVLREDFEIITPEKTDIPNEWIRLRHIESGKMSTMQALPATKKAGHGDTITWGIMDEMARMEYAREIYTAINPATSRGGRLAMISTANGISNPETETGNYFHLLWDSRDERGISAKFLAWNLHPERGDHGDDKRRPEIIGPGRDPQWYTREALALPTVERNQQYPLNADDAFMQSAHTFFEMDDIQWYYDHGKAKPLFAGAFDQTNAKKADFRFYDEGPLKVYATPEYGVSYILSADVASGSGADRSVADVLDTRNGQVVAHFRAKLSPNEFADQLYWIGKWYNTAKIAVERSGGWGEAVNARLRDGYLGRPVYSNIYRHTEVIKGNRPISDLYGFPMSVATRPLVLAALYKYLRDRAAAALPMDAISELRTFVYRDTKPSPRAMEGAHDDCVMSLAIGVYLTGKYSPAAEAARVRRKKTSTGYKPLPTRTY